MGESVLTLRVEASGLFVHSDKRPFLQIHGHMNICTASIFLNIILHLIIPTSQADRTGQNGAVGREEESQKERDRERERQDT